MLKGLKELAALLSVSIFLGGCSQTAPAVSVNEGPPAVPIVQAELLPPPYVPAPRTFPGPATVLVELETVEVKMRLADNVEYPFWTFGGQVPGPMIRVRHGDTVELVMKNNGTSTMPHSIDLHAVTGPGGGAVLTQTAPGGKSAFRFQALNPGLYVYHCATPVVPEHIANGMYGLILVEPAGGLPPVDREYYVMEGEFYTSGSLGEPGSYVFSLQEMLAELPDYVVFNGSTVSLMNQRALKAKVGERVRFYFGVGGPNLTSSFHVIGEIFDIVYPEGASEVLSNVQTTLVPAGGAVIVELTFQVPGSYLLVDHSLGRLLKGAAGQIIVEGEPAPGIFSPLQNGLQGVAPSDVSH